MDVIGEFSVAQFFHDDFYEYVARFVSAGEAVLLARNCTRSVAAQTGIVNRVIVTDGGDNTVFEWKRGEGITFPPQAKGKV